MRLPRKPVFMALLVVSLLAAALFSPVAGKNKKMKEKDAGTSLVMEWLVYGPHPAPLPAFHDGKPGSFGIKEMIAADRFPAGALWPEAGQDGWEHRTVGDEDAVVLGKPDGWTGPAEAWLATYI
ncbi:MAG: hypothetical protein IFK94_15330, partial [Acidobacteria bacterium]|nr:hypothetical protein [Candidatus Polarisedimenticola svalbardensis]